MPCTEAFEALDIASTATLAYFRRRLLLLSLLAIFGQPQTMNTDRILSKPRLDDS